MFIYGNGVWESARQLMAQLEDAAEAFPALVAERDPRFLQVVASSLACPWAVFWKARENEFKCFAAWHADARARPIASPMPTGRPGAVSVWRYAEPRVSRDAAADGCLPRSVQADDAGLRAGVWFAVGPSPAIHGVVELRTRQFESLDYRTIRVFERFGRGLPRRF